MTPARKRPSKTAPTPPEQDVAEKQDKKQTQGDFLRDLNPANRRGQQLDLIGSRFAEQLFDNRRSIGHIVEIGQGDIRIPVDAAGSISHRATALSAPLATDQPHCARAPLAPSCSRLVQPQ